MLDIPLPLLIPSSFSFPASYSFPIQSLYKIPNTCIPSDASLLHFNPELIMESRGKSLSIRGIWSLRAGAPFFGYGKCSVLWSHQPADHTVEITWLPGTEVGAGWGRSMRWPHSSSSRNGARKYATDKSKVLTHRKCPCFTGVWW